MSAGQVNLTLALLLAFWCVPSTTQAQGLRMPTAAIVVGNALDSVSTEIVAQGPNVREGNPFMGQSSSQRLLMKSASTAVQVWMVRKIGRTHPKIATGVGLAIGAAMSGVAVHNLRLAR